MSPSNNLLNGHYVNEFKLFSHVQGMVMRWAALELWLVKISLPHTLTFYQNMHREYLLSNLHQTNESYL